MSLGEARHLGLTKVFCYIARPDAIITFDHPEILIPHGHEAGENPLGPEMAKDAFLHLPAVGKDGRTAEQGPLLPFESYLQP